MYKKFGKRKDLNFKFNEQYKSILKNINLENFKRIIPSKIKAILWLIRKIIFTLPLLLDPFKGYKNCKPDFIFVDYLINLDEKSFLRGEFQSNYWGSLINKINKKSN